MRVFKGWGFKGEGVQGKGVYGLGCSRDRVFKG